MQRAFQTLLTTAGTWMARPMAFVVVVVYTAFWLILDRGSFNFHGAIALLTLCMTLFIQRSEHRDTQAIQAKLDELLRAVSTAQSGLTRLDEKEPEQIEAYRDQAKARDPVLSDQVISGDRTRTRSLPLPVKRLIRGRCPH